MMEYRFRPIHQWPRPFTKNRKWGSFQVSYLRTLKDLEKELNHLGAKNVVIEADFRADDICLDGLPRANARKPGHPGVIVSFDSHKGPLSFACDAFEEWQSNLRGIALTLERLRLVDLYGVTQSGEQYKGWAALPPSGGSETFETKEAAAGWLAARSDTGHIMIDVLNVVPVRTNVIRELTRRFHPDNGGDPADFRRLQNAKEILEKR